MNTLNDNVKAPKFLEVKQTINGLIFELGNGSKIKLDASTLNEVIKQQAMMHGLNQKIRDAAAGFSKESNFTGAQEAMQAVIDSLTAGTWNRQGGGESTGGILAEAIAKIKKVPLEKAQSAVGAATDEQRKVWMSSPMVKAAIAQIRAERAKAAAKTSNDDLQIDL